MKGVLHVRPVLPTIQSLIVRFVFGEQQPRLAGAKQPSFAILPMIQFGAQASWHAGSNSHRGTARVLTPRPGIAKPQGRQQVQLSALRPAIYRGDANQDIFDIGLRVFHKYVKVAVLLEHSGIEQLKFRLLLAPAPIFLQQPRIRKLPLWVLVEHAHVAVRWRRIQVKILLLDVLAVVSFVARQAEKPLLQYGIAPIPHRQAKANHLVPVADASDAVFAPSICSRAGMVVRKILPCGTARAVILAHRTPLPLGQIRPPALPMLLPGTRLFQSVVFYGLYSCHDVLDSLTIKKRHTMLSFFLSSHLLKRNLHAR